MKAENNINFTNQADRAERVDTNSDIVELISHTSQHSNLSDFMVTGKPKRHDRFSIDKHFKIYMRENKVFVESDFNGWILLDYNKLHHSSKSMGYIKIEYDVDFGSVILYRINDYREVIAKWFLKNDILYSIGRTSLKEIKSEKDYREQSLNLFCAKYNLNSEKTFVKVGKSSEINITKENCDFWESDGFQTKRNEELIISGFEYIMLFKNVTFERFKGVINKVFLRKVFINITYEDEEALFTKLENICTKLNIQNKPEYFIPKEEEFEKILHTHSQ